MPDLRKKLGIFGWEESNGAVLEGAIDGAGEGGGRDLHRDSEDPSVAPEPPRRGEIVVSEVLVLCEGLGEVVFDVLRIVRDIETSEGNVSEVWRDGKVCGSGRFAGSGPNLFTSRDPGDIASVIDG